MTSLESANPLIPLFHSQSEPQTKHAPALDVSPQNQSQTDRGRNSAHHAEECGAPAYIPTDPHQQYPGINQKKAAQDHQRATQIAAVVNSRFQIRSHILQTIVCMPQLVIVENALFQTTQRLAWIAFRMDIHPEAMADMGVLLCPIYFTSLFRNRHTSS